MLVGDCGGLVKELCLALPAAFFAREGLSGTVSLRPLVPVGNLLSSLPQGIGVHIFVDHEALDNAALWLRGLILHCSVQLVTLGLDRKIIATPWIQDLLHFQSAVQGCKLTEVISRPESDIAVAVADHLQTSFSPKPFHIAGGNQLIGQNFRLVGASEVIRGSSIQRRTHVDQVRWNAADVLDARRMGVFGYRAADMDREQIREFPTKGDYDTSSSHPEQLPETSFCMDHVHQCGFHVDQFVSVTGLSLEGCPLLLVADPFLENGGEDRFALILKRQLNASAFFLEQQGFAVIRNPMPVIAPPDTVKRAPRLYNNVLLENACRRGRTRPLVWVPQFSDVEPLDKFDFQNLAIWRRLGFDPVPVPGWSHLASRNGAIRCVTKILRRENSS